MADQSPKKRPVRERDIPSESDEDSSDHGDIKLDPPWSDHLFFTPWWSDSNSGDDDDNGPAPDRLSSDESVYEEGELEEEEYEAVEDMGGMEVTPNGSGSTGGGDRPSTSGLNPATVGGPLGSKRARIGGIGDRGEGVVGRRGHVIVGNVGRGRVDPGLGGWALLGQGDGDRGREACAPRRRGGRAALERQRRQEELDGWHHMDEPSGFPVRPFGGPVPGYSGRYGAMLTPIDFFSLFFNQILLQMIVDQTNLYFTQRKPGTQFVELTARELKAFFGMVVMISIKGLTVLEHIWSTLAFFHDASLANIMPRDRFFWILGNMHFNNNKEAPEDPAQDRLFKIRPVIHHLTTQFQVQYNLHEHFAGDEAMVTFQGRHSGKQYDPSKPIKRGFKIWTLADSISGYVYNFAVYMGRFGNPDHRDLGRRAILNLITPDLHNLNYRLYCDRFFTSMPLLRDLQEIGIYCCGTIQCNQQGYSPSLKQLKKHEKNMERGEFHFAKHIDGMCGYAWKDKKLVYFLSSAHSGDLPPTTVTRNIDNRGNRGNIPCPQAIADYNKYMGGVDHADQIKSYYAVNRKSRRWYMRLFWHSFDTSISNAFILHKETRPAAERHISQIQFRYKLAEELIGGYSSRRRIGRPQIAHPIRVAPSHQHTLVDLRPEFPRKRRCSVCLQNKTRHETFYGCARCNNTPLCNHVGRNCFEIHHRNIEN
ncbi:piggyBac transposable element-derived protein 4-like [Antedon mediterranea]|uniref:piggyBac transposable element-derived protein 4-like n=1 Tax=Antedon mediterranea TaxID=105859 RepID=UPI003AF57FE3